jgi:hypothetical protein
MPIATTTKDSRRTAALSAERHSNADFVGPASDAVRHHPKQTDRDQQEPQASEQRVRHCEQSFLRKESFDELRLSGHSEDRDIRIRAPDGLANRVLHRGRIHADANHETCSVGRFARERKVERRRSRVTNAVVLGVGNDADDFRCAGPVGRKPVASAQRVPAREEHLCQGFVDHTDLWSVR